MSKKLKGKCLILPNLKIILLKKILKKEAILKINVHQLFLFPILYSVDLIFQVWVCSFSIDSLSF